MGHPLAGLDQKIDDLRQWNVQQRRHLGARLHDPVEVDLRCREMDTQVARAMHSIRSFKQLATCKKRSGNSFCRNVHATPLT